MSEPVDLVNDLMDFGLTALEAKAYLSLNLGGIMSANQISKSTSIARAEVYRILRNLVEKGIIKEELGRPRLYESYPPDVMMDTLRGNYEKKIRDLYIKQEKLSDFLLKRRNMGLVEDQVEKFELIRTLPRIIEKIIDLTMFLDTELLVINDETTLLARAEMDELNEVTRLAAERGVKIKMITVVNQNTMSFVKDMLRYSEVRHSNFVSFTLLVFDKKHTIIASSLLRDKRFHDKTDILTNSKEFVAIARSHFDLLWGTSEDARSIIK
jgi:sugar-specific transcriptional regulator TrmB